MKGERRISKSGHPYINRYRKKKTVWLTETIVLPNGKRTIRYRQTPLVKPLPPELPRLTSLRCRPADPRAKSNIRECLRRDDFTCQICGLKGDRTSLNVHHKDGNGEHSIAPNHTLDNLITLCDSCHQNLHLKLFDKHKSIVALRKEGYSLQTIANMFGVSRQRIDQILKKPKS